jgi:hypothetical protein
LPGPAFVLRFAESKLLDLPPVADKIPD